VIEKGFIVFKKKRIYCI